MNWAPCLAASWARSSCFWIIDSLSPVQLAWTSAPRTVRGIGRAPRTLIEWNERRQGTPWTRPATNRCNASDSPGPGPWLRGGGPARHPRSMAVVHEPRPSVADLPSPVVVVRSRQVSAVAWTGLAGFAASFALVRARLSDAFDLAVTI